MCVHAMDAGNKPRQKPRISHPLQIPARRWESVAVDFVTDLPVTRNQNDTFVFMTD
jgi:hypothetical protein